MNDAIRRVVAFTAIATVVYVVVVAAAATLPFPGVSGSSSAPLGVGAGGLIAYYLVYMDGYEELRERL